MKTDAATLTDRIITILAAGPAEANDVWDTIGDPAVRRADVVTELRALCEEGRVTNGQAGVAGRVYALVDGDANEAA